MKVVTPLMAALSFMTRIAPARVYEDGVFAATIKYMPLVGAIIGGLVVIPFYFGFLRGHAWLQAWLLLVLSLWITRGLHWDGWADVFDAWGSGAQGDTFWTVMKDSRLGAFGGIALIMALVGQLFLLRNALLMQAFEAVAWSFVLGRATCAWTAFMGRGLERSSGLGRTFLPGADWRAMVVVTVQVFGLGLLVRPPGTMIPAFALAALGVVELGSLARKQGGMNGDFLGAAVIWGELSGLIGYTVASGVRLF